MSLPTDSTPQQTTALVKSIDEALNEGRGILKQLENTSFSYTQKSSEYLFAIGGGSVGLLGASLLAPALPAFFLGPLGIGIVGMALGVSGGILCFRGPRLWMAERMGKIQIIREEQEEREFQGTLSKLKTLLTNLREQIEALPSSADQSIKDEMWKQYRWLIESQVALIKRYLPQDIGQDLPPELSLPFGQSGIDNSVLRSSPVQNSDHKL